MQRRNLSPNERIDNLEKQVKVLKSQNQQIFVVLESVSKAFVSQKSVNHGVLKGLEKLNAKPPPKN